MQQLAGCAGEIIGQTDLLGARDVRCHPVGRIGIKLHGLADADHCHLDALLVEHDILRSEKAVADAADQPVRGGAVDIPACPVILGHIDIVGLALHALRLILQPEDGADHLREAGARDCSVRIERIARREDAALCHARSRCRIIRLLRFRGSGFCRYFGRFERFGRNVACQRLGNDLAVVVFAHALLDLVERIRIGDRGNHQHRQKQCENTEQYVFHPYFWLSPRGKSILSFLVQMAMTAIIVPRLSPMRRCE